MACHLVRPWPRYPCGPAILLADFAVIGRAMLASESAAVLSPPTLCQNHQNQTLQRSLSLIRFNHSPLLPSLSATTLYPPSPPHPPSVASRSFPFPNFFTLLFVQPLLSTISRFPHQRRKQTTRPPNPSLPYFLTSHFLPLTINTTTTTTTQLEPSLIYRLRF